MTNSIIGNSTPLFPVYCGVCGSQMVPYTDPDNGDTYLICPNVSQLNCDNDFRLNTRYLARDLALQFSQDYYPSLQLMLLERKGTLSLQLPLLTLLRKKCSTLAGKMNMLHMKGDCWNLLNDVNRQLRLAEADIHSNTAQLEEMLMLWDNEVVTEQHIERILPLISRVLYYPGQMAPLYKQMKTDPDFHQLEKWLHTLNEISDQLDQGSATRTEAE